MTPPTPTTASPSPIPAIEQSELVVFTVDGDDKRDAFARVRAGDDVPAAHVTARRVIWLVDAAAMGS